MKIVTQGFTLVELLVVIAVMAAIGVITLANYRTFGEDRNLKNAVLDVQSMFRAAQTSATSNTICTDDKSGATWQLVFSSNTDTSLKCQGPSGPLTTKKTAQLSGNIVIDSVTGNGSDCPSIPPFSSFTISFAPLTGQVTLGGTNCTKLDITLKNNTTSNTKSLTIEQGGRIYAQ